MPGFAMGHGRAPFSEVIEIARGPEPRPGDMFPGPGFRCYIRVRLRPGFERLAALTLIAIIGSAAQQQALPVLNATALPAERGFDKACEAFSRPR
jgi:hypothetical protein